ncbi:MAG: hypothetical protein RPU34_14715 [Candidatus Sedimenticola sp. (ex Thyasira tokunagai)]
MNDQDNNRVGFIEKILQWIFNATGILFILAGIGLFGFQIFIYLKHGEWVEFPLTILTSFGPEKLVSWLSNPTSWQGLHKIIDGTLELIPLSLFAVIAGSVMVSYET